MKSLVSPHTVAILVLSAIAPLSAQNLTCTAATAEGYLKADSVYGNNESGFSAEASVLPGRYELPTSSKAQGTPSEGKPVYAAQDIVTLESQISDKRNVESVVDLSLLRSASVYRKVATKGQPYVVETDGLQTGLAMISATYRESGKPSNAGDCLTISLAVEQQTKIDVAKVLEVVEAETLANPACACEVVKAAINASEADVRLVVNIVETAITAAPENMRIVSQCAIATMPESIAGVQALLAKIDPNSGDAGAQSSKDSATSAKSSKDAKGAKVGAIVAPVPPDPLDRPYISIPPPIIHRPPPVSEVNPTPYDC